MLVRVYKEGVLVLDLKRALEFFLSNKLLKVGKVSLCQRGFLGYCSKAYMLGVACCCADWYKYLGAGLSFAEGCCGVGCPTGLWLIDDEYTQNRSIL
ncbi:hypothetical protein VNO80_06871 [Phaseolus coccineus]|uniref:Uncharacterized protein n=1 Tax=Phaseolus coccineus TaxID=3886 RepID=A0AAN9NME6_PHACN